WPAPVWRAPAPPGWCGPSARSRAGTCTSSCVCLLRDAGKSEEVLPALSRHGDVLLPLLEEGVYVVAQGDRPVDERVGAWDVRPDLDEILGLPVRSQQLAQLGGRR